MTNILSWSEVARAETSKTYVRWIDRMNLESLKQKSTLGRERQFFLN
ncbi:hypothetical protein [Ligilactobacillus apodemi]|nr:hypothetical protein [Ligilactobacillus apodemi]MCR1901694.1 hypothetical protein [Ligilactobacillus apodemi]